MAQKECACGRSPTVAKGMCRRCYGREYYRSKPEYRERLKEQQRERRAGDPERVRAYNVEYYAQNKDKETARRRAWTQANRDRQQAYMKAYGQANLKRNAERQEERRQRVAAAPGSFTESEWEELKAKCGEKCAYCGCQDSFLTVDHMIPVVRGGSNDITNIAPACLPCNNRKGAKTPDEYSNYLAAQEGLARHG